MGFFLLYLLSTKERACSFPLYAPNPMQVKKLTLNPTKTIRFIKHAIARGLVPFVKGSPGIGKSDIAHKVAEDEELFLIDVRLSQMDPTDLNGFPHKGDNGRSTYLPMTTWPLAGDGLPINPKTGKPFKGWLIFFDELPAASPAVQAAAYKILLDRKVGDFKLHPEVRMCAAGNLTTDNAVAEDMSTALQSRLVHTTLKVTLKDWMNWAVDNNIDNRIMSFLEWKPEMLYTFKPDHTDDTYASPRTWAFADKQLNGHKLGQDPEFDRALLTGTISQGPAREFLSFCEFFLNLPTLDQIIANPEGIAIPTEPGVLYALSGMLASYIDGANAPQLYKFISRMGVEYQIITLRNAIRRDQTLVKTPDILKWVSQNASSMF